MGVLILFILQFAAVVLAWLHHRRSAITIFAITLVFGIGFFIHHMTSAVGLSL
ncbi:MAG TPA: DUF5993 family protein [Gammaproteobacteria bacterium]|nr:DUF5993 family protein [Gammaproteobacteria bacterium]